MKLKFAIVFVASIASRAYASGNLRSGKNLVGPVEGEEINSNLVEETVVVQMNDKEESMDGSRLLVEGAGSHEIMTSDGQHDEENNLPATTIEKDNRKMQEYNDDDEVEREKVEDERSEPLYFIESDYESPRRRIPWRECPTGSTELSIMLTTDDWPKQNFLLLYHRQTGQTLWNSGNLQPNATKWYKFCFLDMNCANLRVIDAMGDGLLGKGWLRVVYGSKVLFDGPNIGYGFDNKLGTGCMN